MLHTKLIKRWGSLFSIFWLFFLLLISINDVSWAAENQLNFTTDAILPDNQISKVGYYDLQVKPGESQELNLQLKNTSEKKIKVKVIGNNAITNRNGALDYSKHGAKLLNSPSFEELISEPQLIELNPKEEKVAGFKLMIPKKGFKGIVLGGFNLYEEQDDEEKNNSGGLSLENKYAYNIGVKLQCFKDAVEPDLKLTKVKPGLDNGYLTVFATVENAQPVLLSQLDMTANVTKKGQKEVLRKVEKKVSLAPSSQFEMPISWENEPLKPGYYNLAIHLKDDSGKKWKLSKEFEIKKSDKKLNEQAVEVNKETSLEWVYVGAALSLAVILGLIWYIHKLRSSNQ